MTPSAEIEPGPHWWMASALTTRPTLPPGVTDGDDEIGLILRKGVVGDWRNYFTPEMNERFEKEVLAKLKGSGLEFEFEP